MDSRMRFWTRICLEPRSMMTLLPCRLALRGATIKSPLIAIKTSHLRISQAVILSCTHMRNCAAHCCPQKIFCRARNGNMGRKREAEQCAGNPKETALLVGTKE
ncbi:hypothetical protein [Segatella copri]|uniref:hypothetical protein n=1 Tax=Segatella TaxID=2974251 RepID=UPI002231ECAC|nr:hypothetical protein [Segatella copri]MCW4101380.1 hypothetical protein [Segatella copri]